MLGPPILYLKGMRTIMFQLSASTLGFEGGRRLQLAPVPALQEPTSCEWLYKLYNSSKCF